MQHGPILVTGGSGFVGPFLIAALEAAGAEVVACGAGVGAPAGTGFPPEIRPSWRPLDLDDPASIEALVEAVRPAQIYHLAARASVAESFAGPAPTYVTNTLGTVHLLEAVRRHVPGCRVLLVSSAEVYGGLSSPLTEESPFAPANPYAASKAAMEMAAIAAHRAHGLSIVRARAFNHTGPGQSSRFVVGSFAEQIARIEHGRQAPVLRVGNLSARRDFLDVRDVVAAYVALMAHGEPGEVYNVSSGTALPMQALLDGLLAQARVAVAVEPDPARLRPSDVPELVGDSARLRRATGWVPRVALETTLADTLAYWRAQMPFVGDAAPSFA